MDIMLIGGLWLTGTAWAEVLPELENRGHRGIPVELPGQGDDNVAATLSDQIDAISDVVDGADRPLVVGHSAASALAWCMSDRSPKSVAGVVCIGGFPLSDGDTFADYFEPVDGWMAFPGWHKFDGPDTADMTESQKEACEEAMVGVPATVTKGVISLKNPARHSVPLTVVCPEFSVDQARKIIDGGDEPETAAAENLTLVDLDSGHWPMITCPDQLAEVLAGIANRSQS